MSAERVFSLQASPHTGTIFPIVSKSLKSRVLTFAFSVTGTIHVAHRLDRDAGELRQNPSISLEVLVKDRPSGGQENRMQITFIVEDINDNPATCSKTSFRYTPGLGAAPPPPRRSVGPQLLGFSGRNRRIRGIWDMSQYQKPT